MSLLSKMHQSTLLEDGLNFLGIISASLSHPRQRGACLGCPGEGGEPLLGAKYLLFLMDTQLGDVVLSSEWLPQGDPFPKPRTEEQEAFDHSGWTARLENLGDHPQGHTRGGLSMGEYAKWSAQNRFSSSLSQRNY